MAENASEAEPLSEAETLAVQLVAADEITDVEIAAQVGIHVSTLYRWKDSSNFRDALRTHIAECERNLVGVGIGQKNRRLSAYGDRWRRMKEIILARAADPDMQKIAGGKTGLLVRSYRGVGRGEDFRLLEEFVVDAGLLREMRELEKQAATEAGQWVDKIAPTDPSGKNEYDPLSDEERADLIAALIGARQAEGAGQTPTRSPEMGALAGTADTSSDD